MTSHKSLAAVEAAKAYQVGEYLVVRLVGEKPNGCHLVDLERSLLDVEPPSFIATWHMPPNIRCVPEPVRYEHQEAFLIGTRRDTVSVFHLGGEHAVEVEDLGPHHEDAAASLVRPAPAVPGLDEPRPGTEAVGYSRSFDFTEAFRDAVAKIPMSSWPDWLATYTVVDIGAEIGGIAGFNHLYVRVRGG